MIHVRCALTIFSLSPTFSVFRFAQMKYWWEGTLIENFVWKNFNLIFGQKYFLTISNWWMWLIKEIIHHLKSSIIWKWDLLPKCSNRNVLNRIRMSSLVLYECFESYKLLNFQVSTLRISKRVFAFSSWNSLAKRKCALFKIFRERDRESERNIPQIN